MGQEGDRSAERRAHERRALDDLVKRLRSVFPQVPVGDIHATVHGRYAEFEGSPVRDFVPVLVERRARESLRAQQGGG